MREIGRGGMGAVYLASRADEAFERRVALKILKRGMDTDNIVRRFRNERQILAGLDHPNIAVLLDGGTTSDGRPFFAMEFVEGEPIAAYCEARGLDTKRPRRSSSASAHSSDDGSHKAQGETRPGKSRL
ncbi:MAG: protein kinase [Acidobacteria bacterium]|nr:protein kinase [Acidobacteriota bacterium]